MIGRVLFRLALRCYPPAFRLRFEDAMLETFLAGMEERRVRGRLSALGFALRNSGNVALTGLSERRRPCLPPSPSRKRESTMARSKRRVSMRSWRIPFEAVRETRLALRSLAKRPAFTGLAVATLALGVGSSTAILSVVNGVLLEPLPYPHADGLLSVLTRREGPEAGIGSVSYPDLVDIGSGTESLSSLVGISASSMTLTGVGEPMVLEVERLTDGLLRTLGVAPERGRDLRADEFGEHGPAVAVVSHGFWQGRLGGREDVLGESFFLDGVSYEIVGVVPEGREYPAGAEIWIPLRLELEHCGRGCHVLRGVGRLAPGATIERARAEIDAVAMRLEAAYPDQNTNKRFLLESLKDRTVGGVRHGLLLLLGAVGLVVLIACANVANLLLVRASTRTGEAAIRSALGASRGRLVAQSMVESGVLSLLGGALGISLAAGIVALLPRFETNLPRLENVSLDLRVLAMTLGVLLVVTLLFGAAPAAALSRSGVRSGLETTRGRGRRRFRDGLLALETALAALLLVGAGLLLKSFLSLYAVDLGFDPNGLSRFSVMVPGTRYDSLAKVRTFFRQFEARMRVLPGVESVGSVFSPPLAKAYATGNVLVSGRPKPSPEEERSASVHAMGPDFLTTMRMRVVEGRALTAEDDDGPEPVAMINETFARTFFPGEDPIGREVELTVDLGYGSPAWRIVGVVADVRARTLGDDPDSQIYVPQGLYGPEALTVTLRTQNGISVLPAVREILREMDPDVPMYRIETLAEAVDREVAPTRFYFVLLGSFAALAALLAAVGIYGVVAYAAASRTREIGLRLALGADRRRVVGLVLVQGMAPATLGLLIGLGVALSASRLMETVLFRVAPRDPQVFLVTGVSLALVALAATVVPARRASRTDPARALHMD